MAKYCSACQTLSEDDSIKFCPNCGCAEFYAAQPMPQVQNTPTEVYENPQVIPQAQPVVPQYGDMNRGAAFPQAEIKPKKKFPVKALVFAGIAVALVVAIVLNFSLISGMFVKTFQSDEEYFTFVEEKALSEYTDTYAKWYDNYLAGLAKQDISSETEVSLKLGDSAKALLESSVGGAGNFDWINDTKIKFNGNIKKDKMLYELGFNITNVDILNLSAILDNSNQVMLLALEGLSKDVLKMNISDLSDSLDLKDTAAFASQNILEAFPDSKTVKALAEKYFKIALEKVDKVSSSSETLEIGDVSQKLTVLKTKFYEKNMSLAARDILKELVKDKDVEKIITDIQKLTGEESTYEEFTSMLQAAISEIEEAIEELEGDGEELFTLYDYVDASHELVGHRLVANEEDVAVCYEVKDGEKVAYKAVFSEMEITGSGSEKSDKRDMTYEVKSDGETLMTVKLEDFKVDSFKNGEADGTVTILPNTQAMDADSGILPDSVAPFLTMLKPEIKMSFKTDAKNEEINVDILNDGALFLGVDVTSKISGGKTVSEPDGKQIDINSDEAIMEFVGGIDSATFIANLKKTSLPAEWVATVESALGQISALTGGGDYDMSAYEDFDYDE